MGGGFPRVRAYGSVPMGTMMTKPYALKEFAHAMKESPLVTKMRLLTPGTTPGSLQHPFPVKLREDYLAMIKGKGIFKRAENTPITKVPISSITAIQRNVNMEKLAHHLEDPRLVETGTRAPGHGGLVDQILLVKKDGKTYCHDGTHRLTACFLRGQKEVPARVVDLDASP